MTVYVVSEHRRSGLLLERHDPREDQHVWATLDAVLPHDHYTDTDDARKRVLSSTLLFRAVREVFDLSRGDEVVIV